MKIIIYRVLLGIFMAITFEVFANEYPNKPIHIIIPFAPGGGADVLMRPLSVKLTELLGQPIILDNKPGANGNIGALFTAKSNPDGYTLLVGNSSIPISISLYPNLGYDPLKDLTPVSLITIAPSTLVTNPAFPVKSVSDLIRLAKAKPGVLNYGSAGSGSTPHLGMEMLGLATGTKFTHIPYKGSGPAVTALLGGEVDLLITNTSTILSQVQGKKLNPIAVTSLNRSPIMPDIPTIAESGYPNVITNEWYALFLPAKVPQVIVNQLNGEIVKIMATPVMQKRLLDIGAESRDDNPAQFAKFIAQESQAWGQRIRQLEIKPE